MSTGGHRGQYINEQIKKNPKFADDLAEAEQEVAIAVALVASPIPTFVQAVYDLLTECEVTGQGACASPFHSSPRPVVTHTHKRKNKNNPRL